MQSQKRINRTVKTLLEMSRTGYLDTMRDSSGFTDTEDTRRSLLKLFFYNFTKKQASRPRNTINLLLAVPEKRSGGCNGRQ